MTTHSIFFDIETAGLPTSYLELVMPEFSAPSNYKSEEAITKNIEEQKAKWIDRAALSPITGKVLAIGMIDLDGSFRVLDGEGDEKALLTEWTSITDQYIHETFYGWNIWGFDLNFLQKRAAHHGIRPCIRWGFDMFKQDHFIDLMNLWSRFDSNVPSSLDAVSRFLGVGCKSGAGKDFAALWEADKDAATKYLENDVALVQRIAERMGVAS